MKNYSFLSIFRRRGLYAKPPSFTNVLNSVPKGHGTILTALTAGTSLFVAHDFYIAMTATLGMKNRKKTGFLSAIIITGTTWIV